MESNENILPTGLVEARESPMKYAIWNNKGGVGKTFITFILASEYAIAHSDEDVVVADLCPQANVSEMLLGGNGEGEVNLQKCYDSQRTIANYIKARYDKSRFSNIGDEISYFVKVSDYNTKMPQNIYLLPGDIDLDICSTIINYLAQAPEKKAWEKSRKILNDLITPFQNHGGGKNRKKIYFFDCNPSFANYTEMAIISADRIIVPCTADTASIRGIYNLFKIIYGIHSIKGIADDVFDTFNSKMKEFGMEKPKLHLFIQNKSRTIDSNISKDSDKQKGTKASKAFQAHIKEIEKLAIEFKETYPDYFTDNNDIVLNIKDGNTLASILNHTGLPLSKVEGKTYTIYGKKTQANAKQKEALITDIKLCIDKL